MFLLSSTNTHLLGNSDLRITRFGFLRLGGWQFGWSTQDDHDLIAAIHSALELGINWIDTAAAYGLGHSEEIVAKALGDWPGREALCFAQPGRDRRDHWRAKCQAGPGGLSPCGSDGDTRRTNRRRQLTVAPAEGAGKIDMPLRILFVPFGSEGDVNPLLWLAEGMAARGHKPTFLITPHYGRLVQQRGFPWVPIGTEEDFIRFARDPRLWQTTRGTHMVVRGMLETLPAYRDGFAKTGGNFDLVVLSSMAMGAAAAAEAAGLPRLTLHMQPALFRSLYDCPVFMEELSWLTRSPRWVKRVFFGLVDALLGRAPATG